MRKIYIPLLVSFLFFIFSCTENINIYENGEIKETLNWDTLYDVSVKVKRNSVCWVDTVPENLEYFSGAIIADQTTAHIGQGEFINRPVSYTHLTLPTKRIV